MIIKIDLENLHKIQSNIDAQTKAVEGKPLSGYDTILLMDTKYILLGIQKFLEGGGL